MGLRDIDKEYVGKLIADINSTITEILSYTSSKPFEELSSVERYAVRYLLVTLAEALMALAIHLAKRVYNRAPETPIHALTILRDAGLLTIDECDELIKLLRLRNLLVHRYWVIDDEKIYNSIKRGFKAVYSFIEGLERLLGNV
ncbi:protein of unknown function DUF86 [Ignisphaera aggregans DSM 17230]|uniref:DUF86 domain-containing protein n=1 Tax=Ignisphaera aggregans (strain DSM 17230 / JCM 13409 / AQ1.S1) TaxID=583356 RepID=E0SSZ5_IGNAA|nr:protein of unknown function DUF86 [Ignisphaera aggregans DSM 17230]